MVFGELPNGPLKILCELWTGERQIPFDLNTDAHKYLSDLRERLSSANQYASDCCVAEQNRYVRAYNKTARDKHFAVGDQCLILQKEGNSSWDTWKGPATIEEVKSPYSYVVDYNGRKYSLHANKLRKFRTRVVDEAECKMSICVTPNFDCEDDLPFCSSNSAIIHESDSDFGEVSELNVELLTKSCALPSQRIDAGALDHLTQDQRQQYLNLLDKYCKVFAETPGYCDLVQHEIPMMDGFRPKRLKAYRIPEAFKEEVSKQIAELLRLGFIEHSVSPMVSPLVCVLKAKDKHGKQAVRTCCDYRYVNRYTKTTVSVLEDISELIQTVGGANFISKFDAKSGYHQCPVKPEDRWLTAFVFDNEIYQWCRVPFGMVGSGDTFVRAMRLVLRCLNGRTVRDDRC